MDDYVFFADGTERADVFLAEKTRWTRSRIAKLIDSGKVFCNGEPVKKAGEKVKGEVVLEIEEDVPISAEGEDIPIDIVYQDKDIAVINKPQGMVTHPCAGTDLTKLSRKELGEYRRKKIDGNNGHAPCGRLCGQQFSLQPV